MKKLFSISFAFLILLSGMHISIATHFCGGEVAAVKWSLSEQKATCGMDKRTQSCPADKDMISGCCHNEISTYNIDNNYTPSFFQLKKVSKTPLQVFNVPVSTLFNLSFAVSSSRNNVSPPDISSPSAVSLADICIFRI